MKYFSEIMAKVEAERNTQSPTIMPTLELLQELQYKYVHTVIYSNLGIIVGREQSLKPEDAYNSVVINNEGGTCLTINLAFYYILKTIGFKAHLVAPLVINYNERQQHNDRPTHMAIRVKISKKLYLVDPGWGNSSRTPVCFTGEVADHPMGTFRLTEKKGVMCLEKKFATWVPQFTFSKFERRKYPDFDDVLKFICEDDSVFRQTLFVTKADKGYCKALIDGQISTTFSDGRKTEDSVSNHGGISAVLTEIFGLSEEYISKIEWVKNQIVEETYLKLTPMWNPSKKLIEDKDPSKKFVCNDESVQDTLLIIPESSDKKKSSDKLSSSNEIFLNLKQEGKAIMQKDPLFYEIFEKIASDPFIQNRIAVIDEKNNDVRRLSYKELNEEANRLAHNLLKLKRQNGWAEGACIGLFLENSAEAVVSILAIMKAGLAFVPLPTNNETNYNRIKKYYIQGSDLKGIIRTNEKQNNPILSSLKDEIDKLEICSFEEMCKCICSNQCQCTDNPELKLVKDQLAYIIFSSGSTGPAKGIKIAHRGLLNAAEGIVSAYESCDNKLGSDEKFGCNASLLFDASIVDILAPLSFGATLVIVPHQYHTDGVILNEFLNTHQVTRISLVPATLQLLDFTKLTDLRGIISTGEKANQGLFDSIPAKVDLLNGYGPTEATIVFSSAKFIHGGKSNLIGKPIKGSESFILRFDPNGIDRYPASPKKVVDGEEGELYIAGENIGLGYLEIKGEKQQPHYHNRFREIDHPDDATRKIRIFQTGDIVKLTDNGVEFIRRVDEQIKYFGELIHPEAIENAMRQFTVGKDKIFQEIKVVANISQYRGFPLLIAYVKLKSQCIIDFLNIGDLYHFLKEHEFNTRVPSRFCLIENEWPLLKNSNKTDVALLPSRISKVLFCTPPFNMQPEEHEQKVTEIIRNIWREVLSIDIQDLPILPIDSSFYELGGDSVRVLQMLDEVNKSKVLKEYSENTPDIAQFDSYPTLRCLVFRVMNGNNPDLHNINWYSRKPNDKDSFNRLIESAFYPMLLVNSVSGDSKIDFRNIIGPISEKFPQHPLLQAGALSSHNSGYRVRSYPELACDYIASFKKDDLLSHYLGPIIIFGYSTGGVLAYEIARQFQEQKHFVTFLNIDSMSPNYYRNLNQSAHASMLIAMINQMLVKGFIPIKFNDKVSEENLLPIELKQKITGYQIDKQIDIIIRFLTERLRNENDEKIKKRCLSYFSTIHNMIKTLLNYYPEPLHSKMTLISFSGSVEECKRICPNAEESKTSRLLWDGEVCLESVKGNHIDFINNAQWVRDNIMPKLEKNLKSAIEIAKKPHLHALQLKIKQSYQEQGKIDRLSDNNKPFTVEDCSINLVILREQNEEGEKADNNKQWGGRDTVFEGYEAIHAQKEAIQIRGLLKQEQSERDGKRHLLVNGRAGIGKTTFCKYIAHQWSEGKLWPEFEWVFWIPLRTITKNSYPEASYNHLDIIKIGFLDEYFPNANAEEVTPLLKAIRELLEQSPQKVLILLDGYDEVNWVQQTHLKVAFDKLLKTAKNIILTTRPHHNELNSIFNKKFEITGFSNENIEAYVHHFYKDKPAKAHSLMAYLNANSGVRGIAHVPIYLDLLCCVWNDGKIQEEPTMTMIYQKFEEWLLRRDYKSDAIRFLELQSYYQLPLGILCELAYNAMHSGKIFIDEKELISCAGNDFENRMSLLRLGFLKQTESCYEFIHLTFQEYFSAKHIAKIISNGEDEEALENLTDFIKFNKYEARYENMWWFVAGLLKDNLVALQRYFDLLTAPPRDLLGLVDTSLLVRCLEESGLPDGLKQKKEILTKVTQWAETYCINTCYEKDFILFQRLSISMKVMRQAFLPVLKKALEEGKDWHTKYHAARILYRLKQGTSEAVDMLIKVVEKEKNWRIKCDIAKLLKDLDQVTSKLVPTLIKKMLKDKDLNQRNDAVSLLHLYCVVTPDVISSLFEVISNYHSGNTLIHFETHVDLLLNAEFFLDDVKQVTSEFITTLSKWLKDENPDLRQHAVSLLGKLKPMKPEVISLLVEALRDDCCFVRKSAVIALGNLEDVTGDVITLLIKMLKDESEYVRNQAAIELGCLEKATKEAITLLIELLEASECKIDRKSAIFALRAYTASPGVIPALINALNDNESDIRKTAERVLGALERDRNVGLLAQRQLEKLAPIEKTKQLIAKLKQDVSAVKITALNALRNLELPSPDVISAIKIALTDKDVYVRIEAASLLLRLEQHASRVISVLLDAMRHRNSISLAIRALQWLKAPTPIVITALVGTLEDEDPSVVFWTWTVLQNFTKTAPAVIVDALNKPWLTNKLYNALNRAMENDDSSVRYSAIEVMSVLSMSPKFIARLFIKVLHFQSPKDSIWVTRGIVCDVALRLANLEYATTEVIVALFKVYKSRPGYIEIMSTLGKLISNKTDFVLSKAVIDPNFVAKRMIDNCESFYVKNSKLYFKVKGSSQFNITLSPEFEGLFLIECTAILKKKGYPVPESLSDLTIEKNQHKAKQKQVMQSQKLPSLQAESSTSSFIARRESTLGKSHSSKTRSVNVCTSVEDKVIDDDSSRSSDPSDAERSSIVRVRK